MYSISRFIFQNAGCSNSTHVFTNHILKFKYQHGHLKVKYKLDAVLHFPDNRDEPVVFDNNKQYH
jgi:hypothetical protein